MTTPIKRERSTIKPVSHNKSEVNWALDAPFTLRNASSRLRSLSLFTKSMR